jgi:hypothetical protein
MMIFYKKPVSSEKEPQVTVEEIRDTNNTIDVIRDRQTDIELQQCINSTIQPVEGNQCYMKTDGTYKIKAIKNFNDINCVNEEIEIDCPLEKLQDILCVNPEKEITGTVCTRTINGDYVISAKTKYNNEICNSRVTNTVTNCPENILKAQFCVNPVLDISGFECVKQSDNTFIINARQRYADPLCASMENTITTTCPPEKVKKILCTTPTIDINGECFMDNYGNYVINARETYDNTICKDLEKDITVECPADKLANIRCKNFVLQQTGDNCYLNNQNKYVIGGRMLHTQDECKSLDRDVEIVCPDDKLREIVCTNPTTVVTGTQCDLKDGQWFLKARQVYNNPVCTPLESDTTVQCPVDKLKPLVCVNPTPVITGTECFRNVDGQWRIQGQNRFSSPICDSVNIDLECPADKLAEKICVTPDGVDISGNTCFKVGDNYVINGQSRFNNELCKPFERNIEVPCPNDVLKRQLCVNPVITKSTCFKNTQGQWVQNELKDFSESMCTDEETIVNCPLDEIKRLVCVNPVDTITGSKCERTAEQGNFMIKGKKKYSDPLCTDLETDIMMKCPREKLKEVACVDPEFVFTGSECKFDEEKKTWVIEGHRKYSYQPCNDELREDLPKQLPCPIDKLKQIVCKNLTVSDFGDCFLKDGKWVTRKIKKYSDGHPACTDELIEIPCECTPGKSVLEECYYDSLLNAYRTRVRLVNKNCSVQLFTESCNRDFDCSLQVMETLPCTNNMQITKYTVTQQPFRGGKTCDLVVPKSSRSIVTTSSDRNTIEVKTPCCTPEEKHINTLFNGVYRDCVFRDGKYDYTIQKTNADCTSEFISKDGCPIVKNCLLNNPTKTDCSLGKIRYTYPVSVIPTIDGKQCNTPDTLGINYDANAVTSVSSDYKNFIQVRNCVYPFIDLSVEDKKIFAISYKCDSNLLIKCYGKDINEKKLILDLGNVKKDEFVQTVHGSIDGTRKTTFNLNSFDYNLFSKFVNYSDFNKIMFQLKLSNLMQTAFNIPSGSYKSYDFIIHSNELIYNSVYKCTSDNTNTVKTPVITEQCTYDPLAYTPATIWKNRQTTIYNPSYYNLPDNQSSRCVQQPLYDSYGCNIDIDCKVGDKDPTSSLSSEGACILKGDKVMKQVAKYRIINPANKNGKVCATNNVLGSNYNSNSLYEQDKNYLYEFENCQGVAYTGNTSISGYKVTIDGKNCSNISDTNCNIFPNIATIVEIDPTSSIEKTTGTKKSIFGWDDSYNIYKIPLKSVNKELLLNAQQKFPRRDFGQLIANLIKSKNFDIKQNFIDLSIVNTDDNKYEIWEKKT